MSMWATDFMSTQVVGNINVALVFGLLQFVTTFLLAWLYARYSSRSVDPLARTLDQRYVDELEGRPLMELTRPSPPSSSSPSSR